MTFLAPLPLGPAAAEVSGRVDGSTAPRADPAATPARPTPGHSRRRVAVVPRGVHRRQAGTSLPVRASADDLDARTRTSTAPLPCPRCPPATGRRPSTCLAAGRDRQGRGVRPHAVVEHADDDLPFVGRLWRAFLGKPRKSHDPMVWSWYVRFGKTD
ncbi:hypothetical protein PVAP13_2NG494106 [Panicum virgatum]|uniref:Uncharacterized protein n=1 Tax=Panicum virgatum TaxID=38727 RepID=A0A8T0VNT2_PANVG|nr:hypothetical protein PVAP13_2NG494106 [Panicum virgatum]